jgi:hypothetical protein
MSFVTSLAGGILGAGAANDASQAEQQGAHEARQLEQNNATNALNYQNDVWTGTKAAEQPYQSLGSTSANALQSLLGKGFQQPSLTDLENTPGYQFQLQQGTRAINENAAANGTLLTGNTGTALQQYGQGLAQTAYNNDFQNALSTYVANLQGLTGGVNTGLNSTAQLGTFGQEAATGTAGINMRTAEDQAQQINNAAAARAQGALGSAAAWGTAAGGMAAGLDPGNVDFSGGSNPWEMAGQLFGLSPSG